MPIMTRYNANHISFLYHLTFLKSDLYSMLKLELKLPKISSLFHLTLQYPNNLLIQTNVFVIDCLIYMHMTKQMLFIFSRSFYFFQIIS